MASIAVMKTQNQCGTARKITTRSKAAAVSQFSLSQLIRLLFGDPGLEGLDVFFKMVSNFP